MTLTPVNRAEVYRQVRVILVRHLIDLGRLTVLISLDSLQIKGSMERLPGVKAALTPDIVTVIFMEMRRIPGIRRVQTKLDNWLQDDGVGAWRPITAESQKRLIPGEPKAPQIIEIADTGPAESTD
ncbi:MAG: hypothetical protein V1873_07865 [Verrucomicrobiota bacterium]